VTLLRDAQAVGTRETSGIRMRKPHPIRPRSRRTGWSGLYWWPGGAEHLPRPKSVRGARRRCAKPGHCTRGARHV